MILEDERKRYSQATMFISFDLVNCTLYKSKYKGEWTNSIGSILEYIMNMFSDSQVKDYQFWKVLGDEVVFTMVIHDFEQISFVLAEVYSKLVEVNHKLREAEIGDSRTADNLAVKATAWIADISPANLGADNIYWKYTIEKSGSYAEYLGTDIDGGFRIAQYTSSNRLVISADLAMLLLKVKSLNKAFEKVNFVAFRILKGIWNGNPYPIFMYHGDRLVSFKDSITDTSNDKMAILIDYIEQLPQRKIKLPYHSFEEQVLRTLHSEKELSKEVEQLIGIIQFEK